MAKKDSRFVLNKELSGSVGLGTGIKVMVDKRTGVNYLIVTSGYGVGLTPLLDREGKPVISTLGSFE